MASIGIQQFRASAEGLDEGQSFDATSASLAGTGVVKPDNQCWSMPATGNTRGDDADHSLMQPTPQLEG